MQKLLPDCCHLLLAAKHFHFVAKDTVLGSGEFGIVHPGFFNGDAVAVKTFKRSIEIDDFKEILIELKIMAYLGDHSNVIKFVGADVSKMEDRKRPSV